MILGPDGMKQIGVMGGPMMIYVMLQVPVSGVKTILTSSSGTMRQTLTIASYPCGNIKTNSQIASLTVTYFNV